MAEHVKRSETGYRCGDSHQRAKVPDSVVAHARDLYEYGDENGHRLMPAEIARRLGVASVRTVQNWIYYVRRNVTPREREG